MTEERAPTRILDPSECWRRLHQAEVGRLAVVIGECPEIFPVNYAVDGGSVVFRTGPGAKFTAMMSSPPVAFEVDGYDDGLSEAWSVVIKGRADVVHGFTHLLDTTSLPVFPWQASRKNHFVRIVVEEVTGRQFRKVETSFWSD